MSRIPKVKQMTYEELGEVFDMTPNKAHLEVKKIYNKMINGLVNDGVSIWDAVMGVKDFLGMSEKEAVDKLNSENKFKLQKEAKNFYSASE